MVLGINVKHEDLEKGLGPPSARRPLVERNSLEGILKGIPKYSAIVIPVHVAKVSTLKVFLCQFINIEKDGTGCCRKVEPNSARDDESAPCPERSDFSLFGNSDSVIVRYPSIAAEHESFLDRYRKYEGSSTAEDATWRSGVASDEQHQ